MHVVLGCRGLGGSGSVALVALRHARELARHARVTLVSDSRAEIDLPQEIVRFPDLHLLRRFRHAPDEMLFARAVRQRLFALHEREPIDFVIFHGHVAAVMAGKRFRERTGVRFGVVVHGDIAERPTGTYDRRLTALYEWATPRAYRAADLVITSTAFFSELVQVGGARAESVIVVPHGVELRDLGLAEPITPVVRGDGPLRLVFAGRLAMEKGLEHLLAAMARVENATLTIAGSGPLEETLRARASDRIRFIGAVPRHELGALYRAHDAACMPSLSESFGLSAVEALACGVPLIVSTAIREIVHDGVNGLQVPIGDAHALAGAITRLANDRELHARLAANAHDSVLPRLSWPAIGDQLAAHIQSRV